MHLKDYQTTAHKTRVDAIGSDSDVSMPILGLAGEIGELLNEYKKRIRDGDAHARFQDRVAEELGDILWYVAETASDFELNLEDIAQANITKTQSRWKRDDDAPSLFGPMYRSFDSSYPEEEQLPRKFLAEFHEFDHQGKKQTRVFVDGKQMGDPLTDNAHRPDGYRFHDVFHLSCAAVLGWSPVIRKHLGKKRRSKSDIDNIEDGGRAIVTEEGVSALVFAYASDHNRLDDVKSLDYNLLKAIRIMTSNFEVSVCSTGEWQEAILQGYRVWQKVESNRGGRINLDLDQRSITYLGTI